MFPVYIVERLDMACGCFWQFLKQAQYFNPSLNVFVVVKAFFSCFCGWVLVVALFFFLFF